MVYFLKRLACGMAPLSLFLAALAGCGSMKNHSGTDQILLSDAVDRSIAKIDFRYLGGKKVYLDTTYLKLRPEGEAAEFVRTNYIISSLRQQMFAANVRLQDTKDQADVIVEARVGGLGADGSVITYGIPASNALRSAAALLPNTPVIPTIPEIAFAKKDESSATAKFSLFAYERESRKPVWQSGIAISKSTSKDIWIFGAGPFQSGTIHDGTRFAGSRIGFSGAKDEKEYERVAYDSPFIFEYGDKPLSQRSFATLVAGATKLKTEDKKPAASAGKKRKSRGAKPVRLPLAKRRNYPWTPLKRPDKKRAPSAGR